ncbi:MAG: hypothetical protein H0A76_02125 [Candidatus Thiodubiliella endoseptemdiera]|uniref:Uncharacterized protein n=1 Tax=Candidatus Thiodubiliella endoseptemdiera TaxID=2738886 RepID=A0A853F046_9GAMM|nr:hypothetical protein [Candidatus Thiodubiliella endoseptemdiera]
MEDEYQQWQFVTVATTGEKTIKKSHFSVINQKNLYRYCYFSNSATITVAATDLQALTHGQTYSYK